MKMAGPVIHVVDDDQSLREAVCRLLGALGFQWRQYESVGDFLLASPAEESGCVILDVCMPGPSGLDLQLAMCDRAHSLPVIFLTGKGDIAMSVLAMRRGAVDFLTKPVDKEQLLAAIAIALQRDASARLSRLANSDIRRRFESLTPRERTVFAQVIAGKLNKQIASVLGTCERTVKAHRAHVMEKMRAQSVAELVRLSVNLTAELDAAGSMANAFPEEAAA